MAMEALGKHRCGAIERVFCLCIIIRMESRENTRHMRSLVHLIFWGTLCALSVLTSGCSSQFFRNRNFDYLAAPVQQLPPLKVPASVQAPVFKPALVLPEGPSYYPPKLSVAMQPPADLEVALSLSPESQKSPEALAGLPKTNPSSDQVLPEKATLVLPAQKSTNTLGSSAAPTTEEKPVLMAPQAAVQMQKIPFENAMKSVSKPTVERSILSLPEAQARDVRPVQYLNLSAPSSLGSQVSVSQTASGALVPGASLLVLPQAAPSTSSVLLRPTRQEEPSVLVPKKNRIRSVQLAQDSADVPTLRVAADLKLVWQALPKALVGSGYETVASDFSKGFYFIVPMGLSADGNTRMLYLSPLGKQTQIMPFGPSGEPDSTQLASQLMAFLKRQLES